MIYFFYKFLPISPSFNGNKLNMLNFTIYDDINNYLLVSPDVRNIMFTFLLYNPDEKNYIFCIIVNIFF